MTISSPFPTGEMGPSGAALTSGASGASGGWYQPFEQYTDLENGQTHWAPSSVLSAQGHVLIATSYEFEIEITSPGPMQGYSIAFFANEDGFNYDDSNHPIAPGEDSSPDTVS